MTKSLRIIESYLIKQNKLSLRLCSQIKIYFMESIVNLLQK